MPRIAGVDIPPDKPIWVSLRTSTASARRNSRVILKEAGIDGQRRAKELSEEELAKIIGIIDRGVPGRRRPAPADPAEHRAGCATSAATAATATAAASRPRPAHPLQRPHPQGPAQDGRRQEGREGTRQVIESM